jgi:hypothetical protein
VQSARVRRFGCEESRRGGCGWKIRDDGRTAFQCWANNYRSNNSTEWVLSWPEPPPITIERLAEWMYSGPEAMEKWVGWLDNQRAGKRAK